MLNCPMQNLQKISFPMSLCRVCKIRGGTIMSRKSTLLSFLYGEQKSSGSIDVILWEVNKIGRNYTGESFLADTAVLTSTEKKWRYWTLEHLLRQNISVESLCFPSLLYFGKYCYLPWGREAGTNTSFWWNDALKLNKLCLN